ncbi:Calcium-transporting ATPase 9, plasma membrane-type [Morella rubra]|uniref:Calcium-transporting ATPase 9, plasma membrane-type n=1 Tax=Morella rubra TaxID=262757 RepID=A0A6A1UFJ8_9ROSI|nr:Calcium-transporting ATPase 9, plasma membrane-type [Morella rubra]
MDSRGSTPSPKVPWPFLRDRDRDRDVEAGPVSSNSKTYDEGMIQITNSDPFDVFHTKNVPLETLKRWRAALLFRLAGERQIVLGAEATPSNSSCDYAIGLEELASLTRDHNLSALQHYGGASHP